MKKLLFAFAVLAGVSATAAKADDWGCQVLLCLSNPAGPTAVSECVPPINKLWDELRKGHAFPSCAMGGGEDQNYATNSYKPFDDCPPQFPIEVSGGGESRQGEQITKVCRNNKIVSVCSSGGGGGASGGGGGCSQVYQSTTLYREAKPNIIDVFIDGQKHTSVRW